MIGAPFKNGPRALCRSPFKNGPRALCRSHATVLIVEAVCKCPYASTGTIHRVDRGPFSSGRSYPPYDPLDGRA